MQLRIIGDDRSRVEHPIWVGGVLEFDHDVVELGSVLPLDEGRHDASGTMLGLERPVGGQDQIDHVLGESFVTIQALPVAEVLDDEEVDVAVLGVAEDD